jgi:hypothetical protein
MGRWISVAIFDITAKRHKIHKNNDFHIDELVKSWFMPQAAAYEQRT